jgi:hypothetical protein
MTRKMALEHIKYAGYHQDNSAFTRLLIENRVSYESAREAYRQGYRLKESGVKCTCRECSQKGV